MLTRMNKFNKNSNAAYLKAALALAKKRRGFCAPNPSVGALVIKNDEVLAEGKHWAAGEPHAERVALNKLGKKAKGASLYVTLEPCCHWGKTPPCTQIIIDSGIKHVYYSLEDPNPEVAGKGAKELIAAGIQCEQIKLPEIDSFYRSYIYWMKNHRPFITAKIALSLDGKIAGVQGESVQLTGDALQQLTHQNRRKSDALLTTINTIINDDPQINVRLEEDIIAKPIYILDSHLRLPLNARVFETSSRLTVFHEKNANEKQKQQLTAKNVRCVEIEKNKDGLRLQEMINVIGNDGVHDLWVETGARCFQSLVKQKLLNRLFIYVAPKILGPEAKSAFDESLPLLDDAKTVQWKSYDQDAVCLIEYS